MEDFDEQESQVYFNNVFDNFTKMPSSPEMGANQIGPHRTNKDGVYHDRASEDHPQDVVEDTQFDDLEADTQANQDSLDSRIAETQFAALEKDTQAMDETVNFARPHTPLLRLDTQTTATPSQLGDGSHIQRPELPSIHDAGGGFKFGLALPRTQNPSKRPVTRPAGATADLSTLR